MIESSELFSTDLAFGYLLIQMSNFTKAKPYLEKVLNFSSNQLQRWFACVCLSHYFYKISNYELSTQYAKHADQIKQTVHNGHYLSSMSDKLAEYLSPVDQKSLDHTDFTTETNVVPWMKYINLANYYMQMNEYSLALENYKICLSIVEKRLPGSHQLVGVIHQH